VVASAGGSLLLGAAGGLAVGELQLLANAILSMQSTRLQESGGCLRASRRAIVELSLESQQSTKLEGVPGVADRSSARVFMRLEVGDSGGDSKNGVRSYIFYFSSSEEGMRSYHPGQASRATLV
jgi:hypothetical protein